MPTLRLLTETTIHTLPLLRPTQPQQILHFHAEKNNKSTHPLSILRHHFEQQLCSRIKRTDLILPRGMHSKRLTVRSAKRKEPFHTFQKTFQNAPH